MTDWGKAHIHSPGDEAYKCTTRNTPLFDNDATTLGSERKRLDTAIKGIDNGLCITECRKEGEENWFILNTLEKVLFEKIEVYLKEHENPLQYSLISREIVTPHEKASYIPIKKYCFAIRRMPLSLKRQPSFLGLLLLGGVLLLSLYLVGLIYKIVQ